jgi:hypothetical protein
MKSKNKLNVKNRSLISGMLLSSVFISCILDSKKGDDLRPVGKQKYIGPCKELYYNHVNRQLVLTRTLIFPIAYEKIIPANVTLGSDSNISVVDSFLFFKNDNYILTNSEMLHTYNSDSLIIKTEEDVSADGNIDWVSTYEYDKEGMITRISTSKPNSQKIETILIEYDDKGNRYEAAYSNNFNDIMYDLEYDYSCW